MSLNSASVMRAIGTSADPRWIAIRLMLQVEAFMIALMLIAVLRAPSEFATGRPLTWLMLTGFAGVLVGSAHLWYSHEVAPGEPQSGEGGNTVGAVADRRSEDPGVPSARPTRRRDRFPRCWTT